MKLLAIVLIALALWVAFACSGCAPVDARVPGPIAPTVHRGSLRQRGFELEPGVNRLGAADMEIYRAVWADELSKPRRRRSPLSATWQMPGALVLLCQNTDWLDAQ